MRNGSATTSAAGLSTARGWPVIHRYELGLVSTGGWWCSWGVSEIDLSRDLVGRGFSPDELARMTRAGELRRVRRGAYTRPTTADLDPRVAHLQLLEATTRQTSPDAVVSHMSAAALHGLPVWREHLTRAHLTVSRAGNGKTRRYVHIHGIPITDEDTAEVGEFRVTSLARTVLDLGCQLDLWRSVAVGDAALRLGLDPAELTDLLDRAGRRHGVRSARRAAWLLDGRAESPQESRSRVVFHLHGLPKPELQYVVLGRDGEFVARSDFGWPDLRTVGEFDGRIKYGRALRPGQDLEEVLFDEKRREDEVRSLDLQMVRWVSRDLEPPHGLLARLHRAFERGRRTA